MVTVSQSPAAVAGPPVAQPVLTPLTASAIFLVLTIDDGGESVVHDLLADLSGLARTVGFRSPEGGLAVVAGVGSAAWDRLFAGPRPAELHPFVALDGGRHRAVATPGDLLFHIRAATMDLCWELASLVVGRLAGAATVVDEVHGFKYFDERDLLGFVDGTENPTGAAAEAAVTIGAEDPAFAGRELRHRPEVPARHGRLGCPDGRGAGAGDRAGQALQRRDGRRRQASPTRMWR